ncbi:MAG: hypothetical protein WDN26_16720 [Chitinophagaceae bacterium]
MQRLLLTLLLAVILFSCQKEISKFSDKESYLSKIESSLKESVNPADFADLEINRSFRMHIDSGDTYLLRVPFKGKAFANDFILLETDADGKVSQGRIIAINGAIDEEKMYDGFITINDLQHRVLIQSPITDGYIDVFRPQLKGQSMEDPYKELPEVIVSASYGDGGGFYFPYYLLTSFFGSGGGGSGNGYYGAGDPGMGGGGGGGGSYGGGGSGGGPAVPPPPPPPPPAPGNPNEEEPMVVEYEEGVNEEAIDLEKYIKCFDNVPDAGATCSIEIFTDIPVDGDPTKLFNWRTGSPGHTFLQLKKVNGAQSVCQNIGFYPKTAWKVTSTSAPVDGKFVDNAHHDFNASFKAEVSTSWLRGGLLYIKSLIPTVKYDIDDYNCTDWALNVFNFTAPTSELQIPRYSLPGSVSMYGSNTPQGVFVKLREMKDAGNTNVVVPVIGWTGNSDGPCN